MIEAETRRHATLDTGHILLGLLAADDAPAVAALRALGVAVEPLRAATTRLLEAEFAAGNLELEISPATDDLLLRAFQRSVERESPTVSDVDVLFACALDAATTAGMALGDAGVSAGRIRALEPPREQAAAVSSTGSGTRRDSPPGTPRVSGEEAVVAEDVEAHRRRSAPHTIIFGGIPSLPGATRSGIGYDSHRFAPGGPLILGGVEIPSDVRLVGHSDGDAVAHAVTDAVLGAAAAGDIGEMFSDEDEENRGRDSIEMLRAAVDRARERGFAVQQVDVTVITERPRISEYRGAMRERLAAALAVGIDAVSVKGKSNEGMGWIGSGEGLACIAVATLVAASGD